MIETDDLAALRESIAGVLAEQAGSRRLHDHADGTIALDRELWAQARELGWLGIGIAEEYGGLGMGPRGLDVLHRELGRRVAPGPFLASLSAAQALSESGGEALRAQWLPALASGERKLAVAAQLQGGNGWLLGDADSDAALVPLDSGWSLCTISNPRPVEPWDRTRAMFAADLSPPLARLDGDALTVHLCLAVASESIGAARAVTELTIEYMKQREQFGRAIASFQALKHRVADMMTAVVACEEVVLLAAGSAAAREPDADLWASLAKVRASEVLAHCANEALQLHGGVGFTAEFDVHFYLMRARLNLMLVASNEVLRDRAHAGFERAFAEGRQPLELPA